MMPSSGKRFFKGGHGARNQTAAVGRFASVGGFELLVDGGKKRERRDAQLQAGLGVLDQPVTGVAQNARHRPDRLGAAFAFDHEHRVDQVVGGQHVLAHQAARKIVAPHAAHAHPGELA